MQKNRNRASCQCRASADFVLTSPAVVNGLLLDAYKCEPRVNGVEKSLPLAILPGTQTGNAAFRFPGQEGRSTLPTGGNGPLNGSLLNNVDFNMLKINVVAATANTTILSTLTANTY